MATYILIHNPHRKNRRGIPECPAWEIAGNIADGKRATTAFGGWNVDMNETEIKPDDRLLFYRSKSGPASGFFAVGRVLPATDAECRELRKAGLRKWYPDEPSADKLGEQIGEAAYEALSWDQGKGITIHINAEWDVVVDPKQGWVLSSRKIDKVGLPKEKPQCGIRIPDNSADEIRAECLPEGERSRFNAEWDVVDCPQRGRIFIRRGI